MHSCFHFRTITPRLLMALLAMMLAAVLTSAQGAPLPPPPAPQTPVNQWVVTLQAGANPDEVAARLGLTNGGKLPGFDDLYVFNGSGGLRPLEVETSASVNVTLASVPEILNFQQEVLLERLPRPVEDDIDDALFGDQWHLNNTGQGGGTAGADANIFAAWNAGYTGTGVVVSSVDDGVWHANPDLSPNYLPSASWDFVGNDDDPSGGGHGTNVAGVMAAADDEPDDACGVGAAFTAQLSGIRLLGAATDANEASALTFENDVIHVYNNSWGPSDNGATLEGPGPLTEAALAEGITNGRGGLGSIYVWAGGNGGNSDNANADGYVNSRYTIGVAATTNMGGIPWYGERGSALLVNAPSNGGTLGITTTSGNNGCTSGFGGTSSASPLVAGVVALMLDANPNLTWRDVQHILVQSAEQNDPTHTDWQTNGAGRDFNHFYGFGRVDAGAAVALAESWVNVEPEQTVSSGTLAVSQPIPDGPSGAVVTHTFDVTTPLLLESVDVIFNATHASRGQLYVELESPSGMVSVLMHGRPDTGDDYANWRFGNVAHWDEVSVGTWTIRVRDLTVGTTGTFNSWQLILHGTPPEGTFIIDQPDSMDVLYDEQVTLSVTATGDEPLTYQWYGGVSGDTSNPVGSTSSTLTTPNLTASTQFWVRVTGIGGAVDSATATVTVVNAVEMLRDNVFNIPATAWSISSNEGKVVCDKQYTSPFCAMRLKNKRPEKANVKQAVDLNTYPFSFRVDDVLHLSGNVNAETGATAIVRLKVKYTDPLADTDKIDISISEFEMWWNVAADVVLARTDVAKIQVKVIDKSVAEKVKVWLDDFSVEHQRGAGSRVPGEVLPPPPAPDGFRGNN